jgi:hypothetical protein
MFDRQRWKLLSISWEYEAMHIQEQEMGIPERVPSSAIRISGFHIDPLAQF